MDDTPQKVCKKCGLTKPITEFYANQGSRDGRRPECKVCNLAAQKAKREADPETNRLRVREWRAANPGRDAERMARFAAAGKRRLSNRKSHLKRKYGMTVEQYDELLAAQNGGCAICGRLPREDISLHVDHCHLTDDVRGILCFRCNNALGDFDHDLSLLQKAVDYLVGAEEARARRRVAALAVPPTG